MDKQTKKPLYRVVLEWLTALGIAVLVVILAFNFVVRQAGVIGESMEPTLNNGERVLVNQFTYVFFKPKRGDIIAFPFHQDPSRHFVKRVIGIPGDIIDCIDDTLYINGSPYSDEFAENGFGLVRGTVTYPFIVPDDRYFVMGDNRNHSEDSRYSEVGVVARGEIDGKVFFRVAPFDKFGFIK